MSKNSAGASYQMFVYCEDKSLVAAAKLEEYWSHLRMRPIKGIMKQRNGKPKYVSLAKRFEKRMLKKIHSANNQNENKIENENENKYIDNEIDEKFLAIDNAMKILHKIAINSNNIPQRISKAMISCFEKNENKNSIMKLHYLKNNIKCEYYLNVNDWNIFIPIGIGYFACINDRFYGSFSYGKGATLGTLIFNRMLFFLEKAGLLTLFLFANLFSTV